MYRSSYEPLVHFTKTSLSEFRLDYDLINRDFPLVDHGAGGRRHVAREVINRVSSSNQVHWVGVAILLEKKECL